VRRISARELGHQQTVCADLVLKASIPFHRVLADRRTENCHGLAAARQRRPVGDGVDAERQTADDGDILSNQFHGDPLSQFQPLR